MSAVIRERQASVFGDRAGALALQKAVQGFVRHYGFGLDPDDREDVVQTVLFDVWQNESLALEQNRGALAIRCRHKVLNFCRSLRRHDGRGYGRFVPLSDLEADDMGDGGD